MPLPQKTATQLDSSQVQKQLTPHQSPSYSAQHLLLKRQLNSKAKPQISFLQDSSRQQIAIPITALIPDPTHASKPHIVLFPQLLIRAVHERLRLVPAAKARIRPWPKVQPYREERRQRYFWIHQQASRLQRDEDGFVDQLHLKR